MNPLISSVHHVAIVVKDVKRAEAFYEKVFNLESAERMNPGASQRRGKWYLIGNTQLHLQEREAGAPKSDQHFAVVTHDMGEIMKRVKQEGGTIVESSTMEGYSQRCFAFDLDGNRIEILERA